MSNIDEFRKILVSELKNVPDGKTIRIIDTGYNQQFLQNILFNFSNEYGCKEFPFVLHNVLHKIDFTGINFDNLSCDNRDFTDLKGVKINPQTVCEKNCSYVNFNGVEFIGPFDGAYIIGANFKGSKGAIINPQTVLNKELANVKCGNVEFMDTFDNSVNIKGIDFTGSNYLELTSLTQNFRDKIKKLIKK